MELVDIQHAIEALPPEQQKTLLDWLAERDSVQWDLQIEQDFSPGGTGMDMLGRVKVQVSRGESAPMSQDRDRR